MSKFFVNHPIIAIVIAILMVIVGIVAIARLPIEQYPNLAPPEILLQTQFVGADAQRWSNRLRHRRAAMQGVDNSSHDLRERQ
jgi:HAE1 family hydrophobic/amphiphilic exporter-1